MQAVALVGGEKEQRARLCAQVAERLRQDGLRCALVSGGGVDTESGPFESRAEISAVGVSVSWPGGKTLDDLVPHLEADFIFFEGGGEPRMPRVLLDGYAEDDSSLAVASFGCDAPGVPRMGDLDSLAEHLKARAFLLPGLNCGECGFDSCASLAAEIVAGNRSPEDCASLKPSLAVTANGARMAMKPYVENTFRAVVVAMLEQLKGYAPGRVEIEIDTK
ncbi:(Fe-S)-binding protein [Salidesulfovibrio onnuriiensis]|uniref:(Fe-S)-binding protein n=1 Tax=Salidesulfovibrio onnuriiensis TaxID=2583823 RepID=UPI001650ACEA|nr:(Fe-S)-binding protein [Salidesulfovibrio onnuriiensis]